MTSSPDIVLTREQVRRVDQLAIERYGLSGLVLMENAGRGAAEIIRDAYPDASRAYIVCGTGNNGGDGCVIARHLHNAGWSVRLMIAGDASRMTSDTKTNFAIAKAMDLETTEAPDGASQRAAVASIERDEVLIDALLGTGFRGTVRSPMAELIALLNNATGLAMAAIDVPSGLDCDSGEPSDTTIRADLTITFVARKTGFATPQAAPYVGRIEVVGIGAPRELIAEVVRGDG